MAAAKPHLNVLLLTCALVLAPAAPVNAYVDPGSGLLLWQLVVSAFAGVVVCRTSNPVRFIFRKRCKP